MKTNQLSLIVFACSLNILNAMELTEINLQDTNNSQIKNENLLTMWPRLRRILINNNTSLASNILKPKNIREIKAYLNSKDALETIEQVVDLDLRRLNLTSIPSELYLFANMQNLSLANNRLTSIDGLENFSRLKNLDLSENKLTNIDLPNNLTSLKALCVSSNSLKSLKIPEQLNSLTLINAQNNNIKSVFIPKDLTNLILLNLRNNQLKSLRVPKLKKLEELNLDDNPIHQRLIDIPSSITTVTGLPNQKNCCTIS